MPEKVEERGRAGAHGKGGLFGCVGWGVGGGGGGGFFWVFFVWWGGFGVWGGCGFGLVFWLVLGFSFLGLGWRCWVWGWFCVVGGVFGVRLGLLGGGLCGGFVGWVVVVLASPMRSTSLREKKGQNAEWDLGLDYKGEGKRAHA